MTPGLLKKAVVFVVAGFACHVRTSSGRMVAFAGLLALLAMPSAAGGATPTFTIANNLFASTQIGQSSTQSVTVTLNVAVAIKSIALGAGFTEYKLGTVSGCKVDGVTVNGAGTVCTLPVTFTPIAPGSTASPATARSAPLLVTDIESGSAVTYAFGLMGAASGPIVQFTPATLTRVAGVAVTGYPAGDQGLGQATNGYGGDNGPATSATFDFLSIFNASLEPTQPMAVDSAGDVYVIDIGNNIVRRIDGTTNTVTTVAGTPKTLGRTGDGGPATSALLNSPAALSLDAAGNIYFSDIGFAQGDGSYTIRMVNAGTGTINSIAGQNAQLPYAGTGTCVESGQSYTWEPTCGDGGLASYAFIYEPMATAIDAAGNFYILEGQGTIRKIDATTGIITSIGNAIPGAVGEAFGMAMGADGNLYASVYSSSPANEYLTQTNPASGVTTIAGGGATTIINTTCTEQGSPATSWFFAFNDGNSEGLSADGAGNIYGDTGECYNGEYGEVPASYGSFRFNIASGLAYAYTFGSGGGSGSNGAYDSFGGSYAVEPAFAVPDGAGNVYFQTFNQIAKLSGSQGAMSGFTSRYDYQTDAAGTPCTQSGSFCETAVIANLGNAPLDTDLTLSAGFTFLTTGDSAACTSGTLAAGDFCDLDVEFTPVTAGTVNGTLTVTDNATMQGAGTQTLALLGTGVAAPLITFSPATINFNNQVVNTASAPQTITVSNPGTGTLSLDGIFADATGSNFGIFTITGGTCPTVSGTLASGASCTVLMTFTPTAIQAYSAYLNINNTASPGDGALMATTLTGAGIAAQAPAPLAVLKPTLLSFPTTTLGATAKLSATLSNPGNATLANIAISFAGANPSLFSIDPGSTCTATLAAGDSCTITVDFAPTSPIAYAATLSVADNAAGSPQTASLTGTGTEPPPPSLGQLQFTPTLLNLFAGNSQCSISNPVTPGPAIDAPICAAQAVTIDSKGNEYILDGDYNSVFKVDTSGNISVYAGVPTIGTSSYGGDNGPAASALLSEPMDIVVDSSDNLYISDWGNSRIREVNAVTGTITTFAGFGKLGYFSPGTLTTAKLGGAQGMAFDPFGNMYLSNAYGMLVLKIDTGGNVTLFAGQQVVSGANAGEGIPGYTGDGGPATSAKLNVPLGVASDALGNIYIADSSNSVVRKVDTAGIITTVAGINVPGNTGDGGPATSAEINAAGVSTDLAGDLYITGGPGSGNLVRKVDTSGNISTYAGGGSGGPGGPATSAQLKTPYFARVDLNGDLVIPSSETVVAGGPQGILQFGSQNVGTSSSPLTLTLTNTGNATIHFTNLSGSNFGSGTGIITGDFAIAPGGSCAFATLASGATCTVNVTFTPTATGARTGAITLSTDTPDAPNTVQLSGTGTQSLIAATPVIAPASGTYSTNPLVTITDATSGATIYYTSDGSMPTTGSKQYTGVFTVSQTGTIVQAIAAASGYTNSAVAQATYTLQAAAPVLSPPGGTYTGSQSVTLTTTTAGASIYYTTNGITPTTESTLYSGPVPVTASGTTIEAIAVLSGYQNSPTASGTYTIGAPAVTLAPAALSFNNQPEGTTSAALTSTLTNSGTGPLSVSSITLTGANPGSFLESDNCVGASPLAAKATCTIAVKFSPATTGTDAALVSIADNAASSPQIIPLSGTGSYVTPQVTLLPSTLNFGSVTEGTSSPAQTVTLKNIGSSTFTISSAGFTGPGQNGFALSSTGNTCGASLAPGASCVYSITFTPTLATSYSATFAVNDYPDEVTATASVSGTGTVPAGPIAALTPSLLTFSSNTGTASAAQTATLSNTGNAALAISGISVAGTNSGDFGQSNNCGQSLAAGASCTVSVTFTPASATSFTATLSVADNAVGSPQTTALSGTGITPVGDFSVNANPSSQTVSAGAAATFNVVVATTPAGDIFSSAVTLTTTGLPSGATALFSPATVTPGIGSGNSTLTIQTAAPPTTTMASGARQHGSPWPVIAPSMAFLCGGFTLLFCRKRHVLALRSLSMILILAGLGLGSLSLVGCGGGFALPRSTSSGSTPKSYIVTVTGTSGTDTHSTIVTLTVN